MNSPSTRRTVAEIPAGAAIDEIGYREYKLLLRPERFTEQDSYHKFWKHAHRAAKALAARLRKPPGKHLKTHIREVLFFDTPHFRLYNNNFILRKRTFFKHGLPEPNHELTLKFRHPDRETAARVDVRPLLPCINTIKFKEEVLLDRTKLGGMRLMFSHGCELDTPNAILTQRFDSIAQVFPALQRLGASAHAALEVVNGAAIEETLAELGTLDFGGGVTAAATVAVWRNRAAGAALVAEFGYQIKFVNRASHKKARQLSEEFFKLLQREAESWVRLGATKTSLVYGLGRAPIRNHE